jgi:hypothetical protein
MIAFKPKYRGTKEYQLVYSELISAARYRGKITYQEVAAIMGLPLTGSHMGAETGHMLGEISEEEVRHNRPMLSAIAVTNEGAPGGGFFTWAQDLGRLKDNTEEGKKRFWEQEKKEVYETWHKNLKAT